ncbi:hypothetical protein [uncultured Thiodictyon sp.]|uniref:hypothetical protein n=1 Tax=uncultured Thiodictyon sp. TaxID=1846217 RepID=UPI0025CDDCD2|nr:hypothetical protein [uncultured Thiodictyon sp.]
MHPIIPCFLPSLQDTLKLGAGTAVGQAQLPALLAHSGGPLLAQGMALLLRLGFGFLLSENPLDPAHAKKAKAFFEDNFVITDPHAPGGHRYYQGKFMIRSKKPGENMNVMMEFCPDPKKLYVHSVFGETLNPLAVVVTRELSETAANALEKDPGKVDLIIRFKDIASILGLLQNPTADVASLLVQNLLQVTGNMGHLFKLGAIATDIQLSLPLPAKAA